MVAGLLGGVVALAMTALIAWLSQRSWVVDDSASHGISEMQSSRLGGVAVFLGSIAFFVTTEWVTGGSGLLLSSVIASGENLPEYASFALLIALVGLWDDVVTRFRPLLRLVLVLVISMVAFLSEAVSMTSSAYDWVPPYLNNGFFLSVAGTLIVTGFVNAGNMADGANGLLGIIAISFFSVSLVHDGESFASLLIMAVLIFLAFNVSTGRIFLGDFGAYGLSALIAFGSLDFYSSGNASLWFFGSVLAYPCIEMVRVVFSRTKRGASPFEACNDHLHNYLYRVLSTRVRSRTAANSITGCCLGAVSALLPASLVLLGLFDLDSTVTWSCYFASYGVFHLYAAEQLKQVLNEKRSEHPFSAD